MCTKGKLNYEGYLKKLPAQKIYMNIKYMPEGNYELNIINQNKLVKKITFKK